MCLRPVWEDVVKKRNTGEYVMCSCGLVLHNKNLIREHYQYEHFDLLEKKENIVATRYCFFLYENKRSTTPNLIEYKLCYSEDFDGRSLNEGELVLLANQWWYIDEVRHLPGKSSIVSNGIQYTIQFICFRHEDEDNELLHVDLRQAYDATR